MKKERILKLIRNQAEQSMEFYMFLESPLENVMVQEKPCSIGYREGSVLSNRNRSFSAYSQIFSPLGGRVSDERGVSVGRDWLKEERVGKRNDLSEKKKGIWMAYPGYGRVPHYWSIHRIREQETRGSSVLRSDLQVPSPVSKKKPEVFSIIH